MRSRRRSGSRAFRSFGCACRKHAETRCADAAVEMLGVGDHRIGVERAVALMVAEDLEGLPDSQLEVDAIEQIDDRSLEARDPDTDAGALGVDDSLILPGLAGEPARDGDEAIVPAAEAEGGRGRSREE